MASAKEKEEMERAILKEMESTAFPTGDDEVDATVYINPHVLKGQYYVVNYKGMAAHTVTLPYIKKCYDSEIYSDDTFVVSFPKTGTTWLQEIVYFVNNGADANTEGRSLSERFPFIEQHSASFHLATNMPRPRLIKSHLPYHLLPKGIWDKKAKVLYVARNPKDTIVSFYHFCTSLSFVSYTGKFEDFFREFMADKHMWCPYWSHILDFWKCKDEDNILFLTYEELKQDIHAGIRKVADFLGRSLSAEEVDKIADRVSFKTMKSDPSSNYSLQGKAFFVEGKPSFIRKGQVGDWKNHFSDEMIQQIDQKAKEIFEPHGLKFLDKV